MNSRPSTPRTPVDAPRAWYQATAARYDRRHPGLPGDRAVYASLCHGARVLEIGAGTGRVTTALAAAADRVLAVDNAPAMLAIAARRLRGVDNVDLLIADARRLPVYQHFDAIILAYRTIQHLDAASRRRFWQDGRMLLSPHGRLAFDTWHGPTAPRRAGESTITPVAVDEIHDELGRAGLRVVTLRFGFGATPDAGSFSRVWVVTTG